jgi:putative transposase
VKVNRELISKVTDAVTDDVRVWAQRPLEDVYPVVFLDALVLKIREGGSVQRRACYLALGVTVDGDRDVLGMWFSGDRGREVLDADPHRPQAARRAGHPVACVDGLKASPRRSRDLPQGDHPNHALFI